MKRIAIFASGSGTNAENIIRYFQNSPAAQVALVLTNKADAGVLERAARFNIPARIFTREDFRNSTPVETALEKARIDLIVLAGFLLLVPESLIRKYHRRIINIHPALLPKFGGKGFYGMNVHAGVLAAGEKKSGITIHYVNEHFDRGEIIFQKEINVEPGETPESLAEKIHRLEYEHFPRVIEEVLQKLETV